MAQYNDVSSIVIDLGFENTKIGYSGDENPKNIFSSNVGVPLDLEEKIKNEIYRKCLCTKDEFYMFNLIYPLFYLQPRENIKLKNCLYLDNKNNFNINEDVLEKILFMNINGDRSVYKLIQNRIKGFIGNKLYKQTDTGSEYIDADNINENDKNYTEVINNAQTDSEQNNYNHITNDPNNLMSTLKEWSEENGYFDLDVLENSYIDICGIKNMLNKYNNVSCGLNENMENFPYVFSLPNKRNKQIKTKIAELLFEKYKIPAIYFNSKSILTGFAYNKKVCSVVDVGSCYTDFSMCSDGIIDDKNYNIYNIGGTSVDMFLEELLQKHNNSSLGPYYESHKEKNMHTNKKASYNSDNVHIDYYTKAKYIPLRDLKSYLCEVANSENEINKAKNMTLNEHVDIYILPDGQNINITKFTNIACEIFFTPSLLNETAINSHLNNLYTKEQNFEGIPTTLFNMLQNIKSIEYRQDLLSNIILTGSSTLFQNFNERFINEFANLDMMNNGNFQNYQVLNNGKDFKKYSSWKGGSILSSFKNFNSFFVTRKEYEEFGFEIVNRKC
ncbi:actin-like protein, putative [Plasmodium vinckei lentum]|uniref:Actin-like protein, putative n=1 Tax=Plasmodium vinckei lentum TaxID=138297 RepID=A0A6V7SAD8_PLAVN|nr:actin-like protein, putative [Plasmodium vinckei lentum]